MLTHADIAGIGFAFWYIWQPNEIQKLSEMELADLYFEYMEEKLKFYEGKMTFDNRNIHLIPPIVQQKGEVILQENANERYQTIDNYAKQLEQIILYCQDVLSKYEKKKKKQVRK